MPFAPKVDRKEASHLRNASLPQNQSLVENKRYKLRSHAKTCVEGELNRAGRQLHPPASDSLMPDVQPQSSQDPGLELGNQEFALTSPTIAQNFRDEDARARQYFLEEKARACAAWSSLDLFPRKYLLVPYIFESRMSSSSQEPGNSSYQGNGSYQGSLAESDSCSDFDSPSLPPPPSDLEALNKTWEQVRVHNTNVSKVSAQT